MRRLFTVSFLSISLLISCSTVELSENEYNNKTFTAIIDDGSFDATKTYLGANGDIFWEKGDRVSVFAGNNANLQYEVANISDDKIAAELKSIGHPSIPDNALQIGRNVAIYPYMPNAYVDSNFNIRGIDFPRIQKYVPNSFDDRAFPMVAVTDNELDSHLKFKNLLGGLKLQLKGTDKIKSIIVESHPRLLSNFYSEELVCSLSGELAGTHKYGDISEFIALDCGDGVQLSEDETTSFIIALLPQSLSEGFTVRIFDVEGKRMTLSTDKPQPIERSKLRKMPVVEYKGLDFLHEPLTFTPMRGSGPLQVAITKKGSPSEVDLEFRKGHDDWQPYAVGSIVELSRGDSLQFRAGEKGNDTFSSSEESYYNISVAGTGLMEVYGNIMSLLDRNMEKESVPPYAFYSLFDDCWRLELSNLKLPAKNLSNHCYSKMFSGCHNLIMKPELPATTLAESCYESMFKECLDITAPDLPATVLAKSCYQNMFHGCSFTIAPKLPALSLAPYCYDSMFYRCNNLATAPDLPATTLDVGCYHSMFNNCHKLVTAPSLPATTLAEGCYAGMFWGSSNLTAAPDLPATVLAYECYSHMFLGCTSLKYVKAMFTDYGRIPPSNWLNGVSEEGTFVMNKAAKWDTSPEGGIIPKGWSVVYSE